MVGQLAPLAGITVKICEVVIWPALETVAVMVEPAAWRQAGAVQEMAELPAAPLVEVGAPSTPSLEVQE